MSLNDIMVSGLDRGQAYVLASYLALHLREAKRSRLHGVFIELDELYAEALRRLLHTATLPAEAPRHEQAHACLAGGVEPSMTAAFVRWLQAGAAAGGGIQENPQGRSWACARVLMELETVASEKDLG